MKEWGSAETDEWAIMGECVWECVCVWPADGDREQKEENQDHDTEGMKNIFLAMLYRLFGRNIYIFIFLIKCIYKKKI